MEIRNKNLDYYMKLPYTIEVKHDPESEWPWFARVAELPGCMTEAATFAELEPMIEDAKRSWIEVGLEHGDPIPEPRNTEDYSGKVNLRMPKTLHRDLARAAEEEGVSLNQLMVTALARAVGETVNRRSEDEARVAVAQAAEEAAAAAQQAAYRAAVAVEQVTAAATGSVGQATDTEGGMAGQASEHSESSAGDMRERR